MLLKTCKACRLCGEVKPLETGFHHKKNTHDRRTSECAECRNKKSKAWREQNPDYMKAWQEENKDYVLLHRQARSEQEKEEAAERRREAELRRGKIVSQNGKASLLLCDAPLEV